MADGVVRSSVVVSVMVSSFLGEASWARVFQGRSVILPRIGVYASTAVNASS